MAQIEFSFIPRSMWYKNFRHLHPEEWEWARLECYLRGNYRCTICGQKDTKLEAHEVHSWTPEELHPKIQKLEDIISVCHMCHSCIHYSFAMHMCKNDDRRLLCYKQHYMKINQCNEEEFQSNLQVAFNLQRQRSKWRYVLDLSKFRKGKNV